MDLNRFKQVNDTHGHAVGDELLKLTGKLMVDSLRSWTTPIASGATNLLCCFPRPLIRTLARWRSGFAIVLRKR